MSATPLANHALLPSHRSCKQRALRATHSAIAITALQGGACSRAAGRLPPSSPPPPPIGHAPGRLRQFRDVGGAPSRLRSLELAGSLSRARTRQAVRFSALGSALPLPTALLSPLPLPRSHPGYFGKVGMRYFHKSKSLFHCPTVNVEKLWSLVPADYAKSVPAGKAPVIDCVKAGIFKVRTRPTRR